MVVEEMGLKACFSSLVSLDVCHLELGLNIHRASSSLGTALLAFAVISPCLSRTSLALAFVLQLLCSF